MPLYLAEINKTCARWTFDFRLLDFRFSTFRLSTSSMPLITLHSPLYLASSNPGKLREFREAASARGIHVNPLPGIEAFQLASKMAGLLKRTRARKLCITVRTSLARYSRTILGSVLMRFEVRRGSFRPASHDPTQRMTKITASCCKSCAASRRRRVQARRVYKRPSRSAEFRPASRTSPPAAPPTMSA